MTNDGTRWLNALEAAEMMVTTEQLEAAQRDAGLEVPPTPVTYWFRKAIAGEGPLAYDWSDKPHRLVYSLCAILEADAAKSKRTTP